MLDHARKLKSDEDNTEQQRVYGQCNALMNLVPMQCIAMQRNHMFDDQNPPQKNTHAGLNVHH